MPKPSKSSLIELDFNNAGKAVLGFWKDAKPRFKAFKRMVLWALAQDFKAELLDNLPKDGPFAKLASQLQVAEVKGNKESSFAIYIEAKAQGLSKLDADKVLIYIRRRKNLKRPRPDIELLVDRGPWTMGTIPFWPEAADAVVIQRRVSTRSVDRVEKMQRKQKVKVANELRKLGANVDALMSKRNRLFDTNKAKAIPDINHQMLSLEFGSATQRPLAPWRRALRTVMGSLVNTVHVRHKKIGRTLVDPGFSGWKSWPGGTDQISASKAKTFLPFQRRIKS